MIATLIPTPTVPVRKFQYQGMPDLYANHHLFEHYPNIGTAVIHA